MSIVVMDVMRNNPYTIIKAGVGGYGPDSARDKIEFDTGLLAFMKRDYHSSSLEEAAYYVACYLGFTDLIPPTIVRTVNNEKWSIQVWCDWPEWNGQGFGNKIETDALFEMALLDVVLNNGDRHTKNILALTPNQIMCIDNGSAFDRFEPRTQHPNGDAYSKKVIPKHYLNRLKSFLASREEITNKLTRLAPDAGISKMFFRVRELMVKKQLYPITTSYEFKT